MRLVQQPKQIINPKKHRHQSPALDVFSGMIYGTNTKKKTFNGMVIKTKRIAGTIWSQWKCWFGSLTVAIICTTLQQAITKDVPIIVNFHSPCYL